MIIGRILRTCAELVERGEQVDRGEEPDGINDVDANMKKTGFFTSLDFLVNRNVLLDHERLNIGYTL